MTNDPVPTPADKLLAMLDEDEIGRLPLDAVKERLRECGVDPVVPDRLRRLVGDKQGPAEYLLSLLEEDDVEGQSLPDVVAALEQLGVDHTAGVERIRKVVGSQPPSVARMRFRGVGTTKGPREGGVVRTRVFYQLDWMPWAPFHMRLLLTLAACWASVGLQVALMATFKGTMVESLSAGTANLSVAVALSLLGTMLGALAFGRLADRLGRRLGFSLSVALCALGAALTPFSGSIAMLDTFRLIAGIGAGGCCVAVNATVQELMPARERGRACLAVNASFWLGPAFAALGAVSLFSTPDGWKAAFWVSAALLFLVMLLPRLVPESPRWLVSQGRIEAAVKIVQEIRDSLPDEEARRNADRIGQIAPPVLFDTSLGRRTLIEVGRIMCRDHWRTLLLCFAMMSAQAFFYNASFFGQVDVLQKHLASSAEAGWHLLPIALGNFLGPVLLGRLVDVDGRRGRRRTMAVTFLASGVLLAVTAVLFGLSGQDGPIGFGSVPFTVALTLVFFFASTAASTAYLASGELFPLEIRALAFAVVFAASMGVGGVLSPLVFGWAVSVGSHALAAVYLFAALLMVAVAVPVAPVVWPRRVVRLWPSCQVSSRVLPERSGKPLEKIPAD
jgi:MFS family permease